MSYYYLVASLPMLFFGDPPPFPAATLRERCANVLRPEDRPLLDAALEGRTDGAGPFLAEWRAREIQLRNAVARARAARAGVDPAPWLRAHTGYDLATERTVADAFAKSDPLEREHELDRHRWQTAAELARADAFGLAAVLAFAAQLRIAERRDALRPEEGLRIADELMEKGAAP